MEVRTGSKSWGYSKRPNNWKRIMNEELDEDDPQVKYWLTHPELCSHLMTLDPSEIEEILKLEPPPEVEEKPKITVTVISQPKPGEHRSSPDSSISHI